VPKFTVTASFQLDTMLEPEVGSFAHKIDTEYGVEVDDQSYWRSQEVECEGGEVIFKIEAEDEYAAEQKVAESIFDGQEITDDSNLTWVISRLSFEVEADEEPMTVESAKEIIRTWLSATPKVVDPGLNLIPNEVRDALLFLLERVS
jgi:hypothetical protein